MPPLTAAIEEDSVRTTLRALHSEHNILRGVPHLLDSSGEQAELVSLRIGEDHPGGVGSLPHVHLPRAQGQEPVELLARGRAVGAEVEVQSVLCRLALRPAGYDSGV
jgi:hypothetical protein